jgi:hypothetical protein
MFSPTELLQQTVRPQTVFPETVLSKQQQPPHASMAAEFIGH